MKAPQFDIKSLAEEGLARAGLTGRGASLRAGLRADFVRDIKDRGVMPGFDSAVRLLKELGYQIDIYDENRDTQKHNIKNQYCAFAAALGLSADASAAEILAAIEDLRARADRAAEADARWSEVRDALRELRDLVADPPGPRKK